ncbi:MAG TPA: DoxX family protein [Fulvivirga sp.]|nr:DoxX family protein [Fulvivirga sp.]
MKTTKIVFWVTTGFIFLFEGVMPALTGHTEMAMEGVRHLGYPEYFATAFIVFKVLGALALIIPKVSSRIKEWAYAGFAFDFIFAFISLWAVDGLSTMLILPLFVLGILVASYVSYHKLNKVFAD